MTTTDFETQHPRAAAGTFTEKAQGAPEVALSQAPWRSYDLDSLTPLEAAHLTVHINAIVDPATDPDLSYAELYSRPEVDGLYKVVNEASDGLVWVVPARGKLVPVPDIVVKSIDLPQYTTTRAIQFQRAQMTHARFVELTAQQPVDRDAANTAWTEYLKALAGLAAARVIEAVDAAQYHFGVVRRAEDTPTELEAAEIEYAKAAAFAREAKRALITARVDVDQWERSIAA